MKTRGYYYDIEDIAVGPGPETGKTYIYLGDIGDNDAKFIDKYIYRFCEPEIALDPAQIIKANITSGIDIIRFQLPDANRDAEALMLDPLTCDIYVFSKRETVNNLYKISYPQLTGKDKINTAQLVSTVPCSMIVGADMSSEGKEVIIKNYGRVYYWNRQKNESVASMFSKPGASLPYTYTNQEEAIAFDRVNKGYYTIGEAIIDESQDPVMITMPPLMYYKRK
jgi:hypothetical protein